LQSFPEGHNRLGGMNKTDREKVEKGGKKKQKKGLRGSCPNTNRNQHFVGGTHAKGTVGATSFGLGRKKHRMLGSAVSVSCRNQKKTTGGAMRQGHKKFRRGVGAEKGAGTG